MSVSTEGPRTPYEVYCHHCKTSFAMGTRNCIHCGARLGRQTRIPVALQNPTTHNEVIEEEELATRGSRFSPTTILWLGLALFGAIYRACSGGTG